MTVRRAAIIYTIRCLDPECGCVHVFFADADEVVFAEATMPAEQAAKIGAEMVELSAQHGAKRLN